MGRLRTAHNDLVVWRCRRATTHHLLRPRLASSKDRPSVLVVRRFIGCASNRAEREGRKNDSKRAFEPAFLRHDTGRAQASPYVPVGSITPLAYALPFAMLPATSKIPASGADARTLPASAFRLPLSRARQRKFVFATSIATIQPTAARSAIVPKSVCSTSVAR
jgi:hypothetical protein